MLDKISFLSLLLSKRHASERGATATEYGLLVAFIAFVIVAGVTLFGESLDAWFGELAAAVDGWQPGG